MALERRVSSGYENILVPLGFSGTSNKFSNSVSDKARRRAFDVVHEDANIFSNSSPKRNSPRNTRPTAKPACRLTHITRRGKVHHSRFWLRSERSRINNHRLASNSEIIWGRTPHNVAVAKAPQRVIAPETKRLVAQRR